MIQLLRSIFGLSPKIDLKSLMQNGAQIIDVRTKVEFQQGHVEGSVNIPLQNLPKNFSKIKKNKPIIICCATGMRSAQGKNVLKESGYKEVYNGGGWQTLRKTIT